MLIFSLLLSIALRIPYLNQSLWLDEAIQALALMGEKGPLLTYALADFQPPLYHFILYGWTSIFGFSEIALRMPSFIFGILTVYFGILIARLINKKSAGIAGLLLATNPLLIYYSQEGRTYATTTFFITLSVYYLVRLLKDDKNNSKIGYFISTSIALWTSYIAWIIIALQALYLYFHKRKYLKLPALALTTLAFWAPSLVAQLSVGSANIQSSVEWGRVVGSFEWARIPRTWTKFTIGRISFANKALYAILAASLFGLHSYALKKTFTRKNKILYIWIFGSIIMSLIISAFIPIYQYFRLLPVLPGYIILLSIGLSQLKNSKILVNLLVIVNFLSLFIFWTNPSFHRENWRELINYINNDSMQAVIAMPSYNQSDPVRYYDPSMVVIEPKNNISTASNTIYYLNYVEDLFDPDQVGPSNLTRAGYSVSRERTFTGLHLFIYTKGQ